MRYDDVDSYYDDSYDYNNIARDCDDLYSYDDSWDDEDDEDNEQEWDSYYHNIANELVDD